MPLVFIRTRNLDPLLVFLALRIMASAVPVHTMKSSPPCTLNLDAWVDEAIEKSLCVLASDAFLRADYRCQNASLALQQLRISMTPWSAAMMYSMFFPVDDENPDELSLQIEQAKAIRSALRDVLCRCICREVGFSDKEAYLNTVKKAFGSKLQENIMPQMMHCFQVQAQARGVDNAFQSTASARPRDRKRREQDVAMASHGVVVFVDTDSGVGFLGQEL